MLYINFASNNYFLMNENYGDRIRSERRRIKMTQSRFALATGVTQPTQVGYENGSRIPNIHYLNRASAIGVDIVYVVLGKRAPLSSIEWVDWDTYLRIVAAIDEWLEDNLLTLERDKTLRLAKTLLPHFSSEDEISQSAIEEHIKLVA